MYITLTYIPNLNPPCRVVSVGDLKPGVKGSIPSRGTTVMV